VDFFDRSLFRSTWLVKAFFIFDRGYLDPVALIDSAGERLMGLRHSLDKTHLAQWVGLMRNDVLTSHFEA
jgi:hypothetical protein